MYDVIIIGAGPAGLFAAYELTKKNSKLKVAILDKGARAENRICPMNKYGTECKNCNPCGILSGYGGAGTFSDGKLNFIPKLGKSDLFKYMSQSEAYKLIDDTEEIFNEFGMDSKVYPTNMEEAKEIQAKVARTGASLLIIKQKHLGSDHLPKYIEDITKYLESKNVKIFERADVKDIVNKKDSYEVPAIFKLLAEKGDIDEHMMYNTYNMGIGMVLAVDSADADKVIEALASAGDKACVIGETVEGNEGVILV